MASLEPSGNMKISMHPADGYRAHHFILVVDKTTPVEIQIKTKRMSMISAASHYPYKNGNLNGELLLELTDLAWKADMGNQSSQSTGTLFGRSRPASGRFNSSGKPVR
jgi:(p)ppGpp synthase/HD superfamily hydrolase